jgi:hypothetical protein
MMAQLSNERDTPIAMVFGWLRQASITCISLSATTCVTFL